MSENKVEMEVYGQRPLSVEDVKAQIDLLQKVLQQVMKKGQHFDVIPGTKKPTLLKAGAEKILATFRLNVEPEVEDLSAGDILRYRVKCNLRTFSGVFVGSGVGEASSEEEKYKWRFSVSKEEFENTSENMKRVKYTRDKTINQVRTNPYDVANTILKMAKKRAMVDATLTVTAASDIFTQDVEDMPEEIINSETIDKAIHEPNSEQKPTIKNPLEQITDAQIKAIQTICAKKYFDEVHIKEALGIKHLKDLNKGAGSKLIDFLSKADEFAPEDIIKIVGQDYIFKGV